MPRIWSGENYLSYYSLAPSPPTLSHQKITICVLAWITTGSNNLLQSQSIILFKEVMILLGHPHSVLWPNLSHGSWGKSLSCQKIAICVCSHGSGSLPQRSRTISDMSRHKTHFSKQMKTRLQASKMCKLATKTGLMKGKPKNQNTYFCGFRVFCFLCPGFGGKENLMQKRSVRYKKLGSKCENKKNLWLKIDV